MNSLTVPLLVLFLMAADAQPIPKFPIGKETTYATGPLDKDGYIDYEAALNERLGKGISPAKNAAVVLWKTIGPAPYGKAMPTRFFKLLGMEEPPKNGDYFIGLQAYAKDVLKVMPDELGPIFDKFDRAIERPWVTKDFPEIASWLKANEKPLALAIRTISSRGLGKP